MSNDLFWLIVGAGLITWISRLLPFVLIRNPQQPFLRHAGQQMPAMIITLLVIYSLRDLSLHPEHWWSAQGLPLLASALLALLLHLWKRQVLLSIFAATGSYVGALLLLGS